MLTPCVDHCFSCILLTVLHLPWCVGYAHLTATNCTLEACVLSCARTVLLSDMLP